jgi:hypothetical protein
MIQVIALNEQSDVERPDQVSVTLPRVPTDAPYIKVFAYAERRSPLVSADWFHSLYRP